MIFISYPRELAAQSELLVIELNRRGWSVWRDVENMSRGQWNPQIEYAIQKSTDFVVMISRSAVTSTVMQQEVLLAIQLQKPIVPVIVEEVDLTAPEWLQKVLKHQAAILDPLHSKVTADRVAKLLTSTPSKFFKFARIHWRVITVVSTAILILVAVASLPTQFNSADVRPLEGSALATIIALAPADLRTTGGILRQHGMSIVGSGNWHFTLLIPKNSNLTVQRVNQAGIEMLRDLRPNMIVSAIVKPIANILTIDVRACDFVLIAYVESNQAQFWHPSNPAGGEEFLTERLPLSPLGIQLKDTNKFELRQVGTRAVGFINGQAIGGMHSKHDFRKCPPRLFFKVRPTTEAEAHIFEFKAAEFPSRLYQYIPHLDQPP